MDACEKYARRWAKKEYAEVDTLSEWVTTIAFLLKRRIGRLQRSVNTRHEFIFFCDPEVARELSRLNENFVIVPADKAYNNYIFVWKRYYVSTLIEELGFNSLPGNPTYNLSFIRFFCIRRSAGQPQICFHFLRTRSKRPNINLIPKMHKNPYKHRFIAGSAKYSTMPLSILLTKLLTHIKQGLQKNCETAYSRIGVNQMWILKNLKELLEHLKSPNFNHITSIKSFDFFQHLYNYSSR